MTPMSAAADVTPPAPFGVPLLSGTESKQKVFYHGTLDLQYVVPKKLSATPTSLAFEIVPIGEHSTKIVNVVNVGTSQLSVSIPPPPRGSQFEWESFNGALAHGDTRQVKVTFHPTSIGIHH